MMGTIPNRYYTDFNSYFYILLLLIHILFMYCGTGTQIIFVTVHFAIRITVIELVLFSTQEVTAFVLIQRTLVILLFFLAVSAIAVVISYIQELQSKLDGANEDNMRLITSMHEGLMILSKKSASPLMMFYNAPIKKIIDTFLSDDNNLDINIEPVSTAKVIGKEIFKPIKISSD